MITWAVAWMMVKLEATSAGLHLLAAMAADVAIARLIVWAIWGRPK